MWNTSKYYCLTILAWEHAWSTHNLFGLRLDSIIISIKAFMTIFLLLSFKGLTQAYLVKTYITHHKYMTFLFLENSDPISAKAATQILSLNLTKTLLLLNFLITSLCNSSASSDINLSPVNKNFYEEEIQKIDQKTR